MTYPVPTPAHTEAPISINFRIPEVPGSPQLTIRASQGVELESLTADVARHGASVGKSLTEFRAGFLAGAGVPPEAPQVPSPAAPAAVPTPQYQAAPAAPQTGATGAAPSCPHGEKVYRSGTNKNGKPYRMWACPNPDRNGQCPPEWL